MILVFTASTKVIFFVVGVHKLWFSKHGIREYRSVKLSLQIFETKADNCHKQLRHNETNQKDESLIVHGGKCAYRLHVVIVVFVPG